MIKIQVKIYRALLLNFKKIYTKVIKIHLTIDNTKEENNKKIQMEKMYPNLFEKEENEQTLKLDSVWEIKSNL